MRHVFLGSGEVAKALSQLVIGKYTIYDKGEWESFDAPPFADDSVLHICIPYSIAFISICKKAISVFMPKNIIVHSTVKPGTTRKVDDDAIYSPVNGRHGDGFVDSIKLYPKLFAGDSAQYNIVKDMFNLRPYYTGANRDELEFSKVMCTTYTGMNIVYEKVITDECDKRGYDRDIVYKLWNTMYNIGIQTLHPEWKRPIYDHMPGKIGGHCITNNLSLVKNEITELVRKYESKHHHRVCKRQNGITAKNSRFVSASKDEA